MYRKLFETECAEKTVEAVNAAIIAATGENALGYDTIESIEKAEREGFLKFENGMMAVYVDGDL